MLIFAQAQFYAFRTSYTIELAIVDFFAHCSLRILTSTNSIHCQDDLDALLNFVGRWVPPEAAWLCHQSCDDGQLHETSAGAIISRHRSLLVLSTRRRLQKWRGRRSGTIHRIYFFISRTSKKGIGIKCIQMPGPGGIVLDVGSCFDSVVTGQLNNKSREIATEM